MKKALRFFLALTLLCPLILPRQAAALEKFTVVNKSPVPVFVAISWYDDPSARWKTMGWAAVEPDKSAVYNLKSSIDTIFYYAEEVGMKHIWGGDDMAGAQARFVRAKGFVYSEDQACPGNNRRVVVFRPLDVGDSEEYTLTLER